MSSQGSPKVLVIDSNVFFAKRLTEVGRRKVLAPLEERVPDTFKCQRRHEQRILRSVERDLPDLASHGRPGSVMSCHEQTR